MKYSQTYGSIHVWVMRHFTKTGVCEECGANRRTEWTSVGHTYTRSRADWRELCTSCRRRMDTGTETCRHGHSRAENTRIDSAGKRYCAACSRNRCHAYGVRNPERHYERTLASRARRACVS